MQMILEAAVESNVTEPIEFAEVAMSDGAWRGQMIQAMTDILDSRSEHIGNEYLAKREVAYMIRHFRMPMSRKEAIERLGEFDGNLTTHRVVRGALALPFTPPMPPEEAELADEVERQASYFASLGTGAGRVIAKRLRDLVDNIKALDATTAEQFEAREEEALTWSRQGATVGSDPAESW
jgi:hypothetical protein